MPTTATLFALLSVIATHALIVKRSAERRLNRQDLGQTRDPADGIRPQTLPQLGDYEEILVRSGRNKISVIKVVRENLRCGLKDAKDLADRADVAPQTPLGNLTEDRAVAFRKAPASVGAQAEIRKAERK